MHPLPMGGGKWRLICCKNAFAATIPTTDVSAIANCTTCHFSEDFSNYWTANLYFKARNGSYKRVPQIANQGLNGDNGGVTVYYGSPGPQKTTAFKPVSIYEQDRTATMNGEG